MCFNFREARLLQSIRGDDELRAFVRELIYRAFFTGWVMAREKDDTALGPQRAYERWCEDPSMFDFAAQIACVSR